MDPSAILGAPMYIRNLQLLVWMDIVKEAGEVLEQTSF